MKTLIKNIVAHTYKPLLTRYLSKTRTYSYKGIILAIAPEVFHPGFFFSTHFLLQYINKINLKEKEFLELGCGSGLISIIAAKQGAKVTATDINPTAIAFLKNNAKANDTGMEIIHSDLFKSVSRKKFDIIVINPPFYKNDPVIPKDFAWSCGKNGEYFSGLFNSLHDYVHQNTETIMVLADSCDIEMIRNFATKNDFILHFRKSKRNFLEKNFIFNIVKNS